MLGELEFILVAEPYHVLIGFVVVIVAVYNLVTIESPKGVLLLERVVGSCHEARLGETHVVEQFGAHIGREFALGNVVIYFESGAQSVVML